MGDCYPSNVECLPLVRHARVSASPSGHANTRCAQDLQCRLLAVRNVVRYVSHGPVVIDCRRDELPAVHERSWHERVLSGEAGQQYSDSQHLPVVS